MLKKVLAVAILLLFIGMSVVPSTAVQEFKDISNVSFDGNTLYVGGNGPNNYTTIQSAIDDAVDYDTIFVYDDSSPYYETINIQNDIYIIGEDKNSTIIDGSGAERIIEFYCNWGLLKNFTIRNGTEGVYHFGSANTIDNCVFEGCMIYMAHGGFISNCEVFNCDTGIYIKEESDILSCYIHNNTVGIDIEGYFVFVENCRIDDNELGLTNRFREVYVIDCVFTSNINGIEHYGALDISRCDFIDNTGFGIMCNGINVDDNLWECNFINNTHGIELSPPTIGWRFQRCNFINNTIHIYVQKKGLRITCNLYLWNYFDDWDGTGIYHIYGFINWDFSPAQEPYDI